MSAILTDLEFLLLGCGYTAGRVARLLLAEGGRVVATSRHPERLNALQEAGAVVHKLDLAEPESLPQLVAKLSRDILILHSVPSTQSPEGEPTDPTPRLVEALGTRPVRMVYLSTTGIYGEAHEVDETTPPAPVSPQQRSRYAAELAVNAAPYSTLILRPAAIYGPGRGVHINMREGRYRLVDDGSNFVSRIHVTDLAAYCHAALLSSLTGAYPVADERPSTTYDMVALCAQLLNLPMPPSISKEQAPETLRANRKVDGRAIRRLLNIELAYPTYLEGVPAAIAEETA